MSQSIKDFVPSKEFLSELESTHIPKWVDNALNTTPMSDADKEICTEAIVNLYKMTNVGTLDSARVVYVSSPFILRVVGGFAAALIYMKNSKNIDVTNYINSIRTAAKKTRNPVEYEILYSTLKALGENVSDLNRSMTRSTKKMSPSKSSGFRYPISTDKIKKLSEIATESDFGWMCVQQSWRMWQGGNQWSSWDCYVTAFRDIAKFDLDYSLYNEWEKLSQHSGPRIVHNDFVVISDRPVTIHWDELKRAHCEDGPFCEWADGTAIYSWHGTLVPAHYIENKDDISADVIRNEPNVEIRRCLVEMIGWDSYLTKCNAKVIQQDDYGILYECPAFVNENEPTYLVRVTNSTPEPGTGIQYVAKEGGYWINHTTNERVEVPQNVDVTSEAWLDVHTFIPARSWVLEDTGTPAVYKDYILRVPPTVTSACEAIAWTFEKTSQEYVLDSQT